jgi:hypothetical protein
MLERTSQEVILRFYEVGEEQRREVNFSILVSYCYLDRYCLEVGLA